MPKQQTSLSEAMRELEAEAAAPKPRPSYAKGQLTSLPIGKISKRTAVFQPRKLWGNKADDEDFVAELVKALVVLKGEPLDAVTVWWGGRRFYVIDGHHRLEAYKRHHGGKAHVMVPCVEFKGTLEEAIEFAGKANTKSHLNMTQTMRLDFAWRLVCISGLTVERIRRASGTGERTVWAMRKKLKEKIEQDKPQDVTAYKRELGAQSWKLVRDGTKDEIDWNEKELVEARRMADRLYKEFGSLHKKAHIFARALTVHDEKLPALLIESEAWEDHLQAIRENVENEIEQEDGENEDTGEKEPSEDEMEL